MIRNYPFRRVPKFNGRRISFPGVQKFRKKKRALFKNLWTPSSSNPLSKSIISFWPGAKEEEERKEKELLKTRVRELEEEVGEIWVVPLKMLILGLLRLTIMAIKALLTKYLVPKLFQSTTYIPCKWKPKVEKLRGRAKKLAEMLEVVRSQVFS